MSETRVTQAETLTQCKALCKSQYTKFAELNSSMDLLVSRVLNLKSENIVLRGDLVALTGRLTPLKLMVASTSI